MVVLHAPFLHQVPRGKDHLHALQRHQHRLWRGGHRQRCHLPEKGHHQEALPQTGMVVCIRHDQNKLFVIYDFMVEEVTLVGHLFGHNPTTYIQSDNFRGELPGATYETIFPATKLKAHEKSVTTLVCLQSQCPV